MAEEAKQQKQPKKKSSGKKDDKKLSYIFFGLLIVGIIVVTIFCYLKFSSKKYTKTFGDNITTTIEITEENSMLMTVKVGGTEIKQKGTLVYITDGEDESAGKYKIYEATLEPLTEEEEVETVQLKVYDKTLILAYTSGETVEYTR